MKVAWVCVVSGVAVVLYACSGNDGASFDSVPSSGGSGSAEGGAASGGAQAGSAGNGNSGGASNVGGTAGAGTGGTAGSGGANGGNGGASSNGGNQSNSGGASANSDGGSASAGALGDGGTGTSEGGSGSEGGAGGAQSPDPVTITLSELDDTYADSTTPTVTHGAEATVLVDASPAVYQSFIKPTSLAAIPSGATIVSAKLVLHCFDIGNEVAAYYAAASWSEGALTWDNKPATGDPIVSFAPALGAVEIDITAAVAAWLDGTPMNGVVLTQGGTDGSDYSSTEEPTEALRPYVSVTYLP